MNLVINHIEYMIKELDRTKNNINKLKTTLENNQKDTDIIPLIFSELKNLQVSLKPDILVTRLIRAIENKKE